MTEPTVALDWSLDDIALAVHGDLIGDSSGVIKSVGIDSRAVLSGSLFVAIEGERFDGHDFVSEAEIGRASCRERV